MDKIEARELNKRLQLLTDELRKLTETVKYLAEDKKPKKYTYQTKNFV